MKFTLKLLPKELTQRAVNYVQDHWFHYDSDDLKLRRRHIDAWPQVVPWLITEVTVARKAADQQFLKDEIGKPTPVRLAVPEFDLSGNTLSSYYTMEINPDTQYPNDWPKSPNGTIKSTDFPQIIEKVRQTVLQQDPKGDKPN